MQKKKSNCKILIIIFWLCQYELRHFSRQDASLIARLVGEIFARRGVKDGSGGVHQHAWTRRGPVAGIVGAQHQAGSGRFLPGGAGLPEAHRGV